MGFIFELDFPADEAVDGAVVYQYAQYRQKYSYGADWVGVACITVVGYGSDYAEVYNFRSQEELTGLDAGSAASWMYADSASMIWEASDESPEYFVRREGDDTAYELEAYSGIEGNKLQRCVAELDFPKFGMEEFFAEYDIKIGSRVYADEQTTDFTQKATA